jgi:membrane fusion protein (multidrug efflux system)
MKKLALLTISVLTMLAGCKKPEDRTMVTSADSTAVTVVVSKLQGIRWSDWADYPADLRGVEDAMLVTSAGGVADMVSEVGRTVKAGEGLCDIESDRYKAQYDAAKASVEANKASQDAMRDELARTKANVDAGSLGKAALQNIQAQLAGLVAQGKAAEFQVLGAKKQYEDSRCQAPFAGVVASRMVNRWQSVAAGTATFRLVRSDRLEADLSIPEAESHDFRSGVAAEFVLLDRPSESYRGTVTSVDLAADAKNRVMTARVVIPNPGGQLRPGMVGRVRVLRQDLSDAVVVPSAALLRKDRGVSAMVVVGNKAHEVPVELGAGRGDSILVRSGLKPGDRLVVQGAFRVSEGTLVKE